MRAAFYQGARTFTTGEMEKPTPARDEALRGHEHARLSRLVGGVERAHLGLELPVARVIVNQAHCIATGGSFDNGLPFSLSMGCGTWGGNSFSENLNYRHFMNVTRIVRTIPEVMQELGWNSANGCST